MSDLKTIKERLLEENRVEELLGYMGCEHIDYEQGGELIVCQLPPEFKSSNKRSVQVKLTESLPSNIRSRGVKGDVFSLVSYIVNKVPANETQDDLKKAKEYIIEVMNYHDITDGRYKTKSSKSKSINGWLKEIKKNRTGVNLDDVTPNKPIDEKIKNKYIMLPYYDWVLEGISPSTQEEFEVGYDLYSDRVVTMIRDKDGQLIGVKGRYVGNNEELLDKKKYLYLHKMNKSVELFNLHRALPHILKHKCVIVWEGYKSVMKCHDVGIYNAVSIEGDDISPVQASLLKGLGIDIEIVIAFDKDKMTNVDMDTGEICEYPPAIMAQAEQLTNRNVYAIVDENDLLGDKEAPIDKGRKVFVKLFKDRIQLPVVNIFGKRYN